MSFKPQIVTSDYSWGMGFQDGEGELPFLLFTIEKEV